MDEVRKKFNETVCIKQTALEAKSKQYSVSTIPSLENYINSLDLSQLDAVFNNNDTKCNENLVSALKDVLKQVKKCLNSEYPNLCGKFVAVGSSRDGTRPGKLYEFDYMYVSKKEGIKLYEALEKPLRYKIYHNEEEIEVEQLIEEFANAVDNILEKLCLPQGFTHGGFASPHFSGVRRNGPASTVLFNWKDNADADAYLISIDLTVAFTYPEGLKDKILPLISQGLKDIRDQNKRDQYNVQGKLHLVPQVPIENTWRVCTAELEAYVLEKLPGTTPVKLFIKFVKLLNDKILSEGGIPEIDHYDEASREMVEVLEQYSDIKTERTKEEVRKELMKYMKYMHIFVPMIAGKKFNEMTKPPISINSAAIKHIAFYVGKQSENAFQPQSDRSTDEILKPLIQIFCELAKQKDVAIKHWFLPPLEINFFRAAGYAAGELEELKGRVKNCCNTVFKGLEAKLEDNHQQAANGCVEDQSDHHTIVYARKNGSYDITKYSVRQNTILLKVDLSCSRERNNEFVLDAKLLQDAIVAHLNGETHHGTIRVEHRHFTKPDLIKWKQKFLTFLKSNLRRGTEWISEHIEVQTQSPHSHHLKVIVKKAPQVVTSSYNTYFPFENNPFLVENDSQMAKILNQTRCQSLLPNTPPEIDKLLENHKSYGQNCEMFELLEAEEHDLINFLQEEKVYAHLFSFANSEGGGQIIIMSKSTNSVDGREGFSLTEKLKKKTAKRIEDRLTFDAIWGSDDYEAKEGVDWTLSFGTSNDNKYDYVSVCIEQCTGGLLAKRPDCFCAREGKVVRVGLQEWVQMVKANAAQEQSALHMIEEDQYMSSPSQRTSESVSKDFKTDYSLRDQIPNGTGNGTRPKIPDPNHASDGRKKSSDNKEENTRASLADRNGGAVQEKGENWTEITKTQPRKTIKVTPLPALKHEWNERKPPIHCKFKLCNNYLDGRCPNQDCSYAHGKQQLDEWIDQMEMKEKEKLASREKDNVAFIQDLQDEFNKTLSGASIMNEDVKHIKISTSSELMMYSDQSETSHVWKFEVDTPVNRSVYRVVLLGEDQHFSMASTGDDGSTETSMLGLKSHRIKQHCENNTIKYSFQVHFKCTTPGSYMQQLVFDVGTRPLVMKRLGIEVGTSLQLECVKNTRNTLTFDRWSDETKQVIRDSQSRSGYNSHLLMKYRPPCVYSAVTTQSIDGKILKTNFVSKMHKLLEIEELTQAKVLSCYNGRFDDRPVRLIRIQSKTMEVKKGELIVCLTLSEKVQENTDQGTLMLHTKSVLVRRVDDPSEAVYEIPLFDEKDFTGKAYSHVYLYFSKQMVTNLQLEHGKPVQFDVQFPLDRLHFCRMHDALDHVKEPGLSMIFPDLNSLIKQPRTINSMTSHSCMKNFTFNESQQAALTDIISSQSLVGGNVPVVIYGPFGSGKTGTLAEAAFRLIQCDADTRVLICTHSNSAADHYIAQYLKHQIEKGYPILRLNASSRAHIPSELLKYSGTPYDHQGALNVPMLKSKRVIVSTLATASHLIKSDALNGFFSHIFIDEAGQALELEIMIPLVLANPKTHVVLAGDHLQISPKVYSEVCRNQWFKKSLLERLFLDYSDFTKRTKKRTPMHLLKINYRSSPDIVNFLSKIFYGGANSICAAKSNTALNNESPPDLAFHAVDGKEQASGSSFCNHKEVNEIVKRIKLLLKTYPKVFDKSRIAVTSVYSGQIFKMRQQLKSENLREVDVGTPINLQGKEFDAVFVSTVRCPVETNETSRSGDDQQPESCFGTDEKLLNAALTRAKYHLAVVGDPLFCVTSRLSHIWKCFISKCISNDKDAGLETAHGKKAKDIIERDFESRRALHEPSKDYIIRKLSNKTITTHKKQFSHNVTGDFLNDKSFSPHFKNIKRKHALQVDDEDDSTDEELEIGDNMDDEENKYRCVLHFGGIYPVAEVKNRKDDVREIYIPKRKLLNRAFANDEIIVKLIEDTSLEQDQNTSQVAAYYGEVVHIVKRAISKRYQKFLCRADPRCPSIMIPVFRSFSKMRVIEQDGITQLYQESNGSIKRLKNLTLDPIHNESTLYIVKFLKWDAGYAFLLGAVVQTVSIQGNIDSLMMDLLKYEYSVPRQHIDDNLPLKTSNIGHGQPVLETLEAFTIGNAHSFAVSFADTSNGGAHIRIHVRDILCNIDENMDNAAYLRTVKFQTGEDDGIGILPYKAYTFEASSSVRVFTMVVTVDCEGTIIGTEVEHRLIKLKHLLENESSEGLICQEAGFLDKYPSELGMTLRKLYSIAKKWRINRLGQGSIIQVENFDKYPKTGVIFHELNLKANELVAKELLKVFPDTTPLWIQPSPNVVELEEWKIAYAWIAQNTIILKPPFLKLDTSCKCHHPDECICIQKTMIGKTTEYKNKQITYHLKALDTIKQLLVSGDIKTASHYATDHQHIPDAVLALADLKKILPKERYECSHRDRDENIHWSQRVSQLTHFTAPGDSYISVLVQGLLKAMLDKEKCPYTPSQISKICLRCTERKQMADEFQLACRGLEDSKLMASKGGIVLNSVVDHFDDDHLHFQHSAGDGPLLNASVPLGYIKLAETTKHEMDGSLQAKWTERIYNISDDLGPSPRHNNLPIGIDPNRMTLFKLPMHEWQEFMFSCIRNDMVDLLKCGKKLVEKSNDLHGGMRSLQDVTSELKGSVENGTKIQHLCEFTVNFKPSSVFKLQANSVIRHGLPSTCLQLMQLTPTFDICLEHCSDPVQCFLETKGNGTKGSKDVYKNIEDYRACWEEILKRESIMGSFDSGDPVIIHNVPVMWFWEDRDIQGHISLNAEFCREHCISFSRVMAGYSNQEETVDSPSLPLQSDNKAWPISDYACIRIRLGNHGYESTWVGHCILQSLEKKNDQIDIKLKLVNQGRVIPSQLLQNDGSCLATIEYVQKSLPQRREEDAINKLPSASKLIRDIACGIHVEPLDRDIYAIVVEKFRTHLPKRLHDFKLPDLNQPQQTAIELSLRKQFSLIQGPPGTGKSRVAVVLAYIFGKINQEISGPKVMCCAPSNKAVDVLTESLGKLGASDLQIVRVYGDILEHEDYPLPQDTITMDHRRKPKYRIPEKLHKYALHQLIRDEERCPQAKAIAKYDETINKLRKAQQVMPVSEMESYLDLLRAAKIHVLKSSDIVLSTCHSSCGPLLQKLTINQVIIDECGMCTEPETMIPLVSTNPHQIVLIGDHQQLRPIVKDDKAWLSGLGNSLFKRYSDQAEMLTTQYRMHEAIQAFPSEHFYEGKLICGKSDQLERDIGFFPGVKNKPIVFINVTGREYNHAIKTAEGSEQSKYNLDEIDKVFKVALHLKRSFHIEPKDIMILSQYQAQCSKLRNEQKNCPELREMGINTVVSSQGSEYPYVILSTVRSMPEFLIDRKPSNDWLKRHLGFIRDNHQIDVALTRAKEGLIIIGNKHLLECDAMWRKLLDHYGKLHKVVEGSDFPPDKPNGRKSRRGCHRCRNTKKCIHQN